jgi:hypothetical protein
MIAASILAARPRRRIASRLLAELAEEALKAGLGGIIRRIDLAESCSDAFRLAKIVALAQRRAIQGSIDVSTPRHNYWPPLLENSPAA